MNLQFRKATEKDIPIIYDLAEKIWNVHYLPIIGQQQINYMLGKMYSAEGQLEQMKNGQDFYLILESGKPVGYFSISKTGDEYMLHKLYILTEEHRKGWGAEALSYIESCCKEGKSIKLTVNRKNYKTINFYFKHGFRIQTVEDFDIGSGYFMNDFIMVKKLMIKSDISKMRLKVCGLKYRENIEQLLSLDVDYLGFIFFSGSPRFVDNELVTDFIRSITVKEKCGVFVNENPKTILNITDRYLLDYVQLHGHETPALVEHLAGYTKVIKVFHANENLKNINFDSYAAASLVLFETPTKGYGGSGKSFDHTSINNLSIQKPFLISGGIHHSDFDPSKITNPFFTGIDVNSRYETSPGLKDIHELQLLKNKISKNYVSPR